MRLLGHDHLAVRDLVTEALVEQCIPNDCSMQGDGARIHIITGPNSSGKSSYVRAVCNSAMPVSVTHMASTRLRPRCSWRTWEALSPHTTRSWASLTALLPAPSRRAPLATAGAARLQPTWHRWRSCCATPRVCGHAACCTNIGCTSHSHRADAVCFGRVWQGHAGCRWRWDSGWEPCALGGCGGRLPQSARVHPFSRACCTGRHAT